MAVDLGPLFGNPASLFGLDYFCQDLGKVVEHSSDHKGVVVTVGHDISSDAYRVACSCGACERVWHQRLVTSQLMYSSLRDPAEFQRMVRQEIVKFFKLVSLDVCFKVVDAAELAEWLTEQLVSAGPEGVQYATLCQRAAHTNKSTPQGVDQMLRRMGFLREKATIRPILPDHVEALPGTYNPAIVLPAGHPRRTW